jgi:hypothetical protein
MLESPALDCVFSNPVAPHISRGLEGISPRELKRPESRPEAGPTGK